MSDTLERLRRAAEHPRGSEDDMFCARYVPALLDIAEAAQALPKPLRNGNMATVPDYVLGPIWERLAALESIGGAAE